MRRFAVSLLIAAGSAVAQPLGGPQFPVGSHFEPRPSAQGWHDMVSTAHPLATAAGVAMLRKGGSAVDAAIAAQLVLGLVEPHSSGIGGGAFLMHLDRRSGEVAAYDGRETAPMAADESLFLGSDGKPMAFPLALVGGRSVGVPGVFRVAEMAHRKHGRLPWKALFNPAIMLATNGYPVSPQLHRWLSADWHLKRDARARAIYFADDGTAKPVGTRLHNPAYARLLQEVAHHGASWFYSGDNARAVAAAVADHAANPGKLTVDDMAQYVAKRRNPLCFPYRAYEICSMPAPSSGGIALAQMLGILEATDFDRAPPMSAEAVHLFAEAGKLAFADRNKYVADTDFITMPSGLTDKSYLASRARGITATASAAAQSGTPPGVLLSLADDQSPELPSTSHLSVVDARGDAVSMTTTIETIFGAHIMVNGYLLNNQLTDFSFVAHHEGKPVANRVEPGKRPRSSMAPVLVFRRNEDGTRGPLTMISGSPGGSVIINFVAKTLVGSLDWKLPLKDVLELPNFGSRNLGPKGALELETGRFPSDVTARLKAMGHDVRDLNIGSGVHAIERVCAMDRSSPRTRCHWVGAADPRRDGQAAGR